MKKIQPALISLLFFMSAICLLYSIRIKFEAYDIIIPAVISVYIYLILVYIHLLVHPVLTYKSYLKKELKEKKIILVSTVILSGLLISVIYHGYNHYILNLEYPFDTFLFNPRDRFMDLFNGYSQSIHFNPYFEYRPPWSWRSNLPFLYLIYSLFTLFKKKLVLIFLLLGSISAVIYIAFTNIYEKRNSGTAVYLLAFSIFSYPLLFSLDRANTEIIIYLILYFFLYFFQAKRYSLSAKLLSFACAMKPFPAVFIILFIAKKRLKDAVLIIILTLFLTVLSLMLLKGGIINNISQLLWSLNQYTKVYTIGNEGLYFGHSLWGMIKIIVGYLYPDSLKINIVLLYSIYSKIAFAFLIFLILVILFIEKKFWKKTALLVFAMNLLPGVSADYKLMYIFIPLFFFINEKRSDIYDWIYTVLFALLLIPKNYFHFIFPSYGINNQANMGIIANPVIMLTMLFLIITGSLKRYFISKKHHEG